MYSREKRMKAVELYIKYGKRAALVIRELGYPDERRAEDRSCTRRLFQGAFAYGEDAGLSLQTGTSELVRGSGTGGVQKTRRRVKLCERAGAEGRGRARKSAAQESGSEDGKSVPLRAIVSASRFSGCSLRDGDPPGKEVESDVSEIDDLKRFRQELRPREEHPLKELLSFV